MKSDVWLWRFCMDDPADAIISGIRQIFQQAGLARVVRVHDLTAVKVHFGEDGNHSFIPPQLVKPIIECLQNIPARPFVADTNVLYRSVRDNAAQHLMLAHQHGFQAQKLGAPVMIADGLTGHNETEIEINAPLNRTVSIASDFVSADAIIVVTHATGHLATGLAATIKNLGMGMASRKGKLRQHSVSKPRILEAQCVNCGACRRWCPADAIQPVGNHARIDDQRCIGCGECLTVCRYDAVKFKWNSSSVRLQHQIAEHALGIVKQKAGKIGYLTFLVNMTKDCDCLARPSKSLIPDIGVIAGLDPVAIDQAVFDLTRQENTRSLSELAYPGLNGQEQLSYGEKIGLGTRRYCLREIARDDSQL